MQYQTSNVTNIGLDVCVVDACLSTIVCSLAVQADKKLRQQMQNYTDCMASKLLWVPHDYGIYFIIGAMNLTHTVTAVSNS